MTITYEARRLNRGQLNKACDTGLGCIHAACIFDGRSQLGMRKLHYGPQYLGNEKMI
jgi:hypothetical protein